MAQYVKSTERRTQPPVLPPLENGDRLDQKTFHERYEAMAEDVKAELIGGIVYMASPQKLPHGRSNKDLLWWLGVYEDETPGVEALSGVTNILGSLSEPEPDACLFVRAEHGGRAAANEDDYLAGAPDWIGEIAASTESIDLHRKKLDYESAGVREYVVVALRTKKVFWFVLRRGKFQEMRPDTDGIYRSKVFPGLWLDPDALLRRDRKRMLAVLRQGLTTKEHEAFVAKLAARKR
jgi:Uma2 family endonuclease